MVCVISLSSGVERRVSFCLTDYTMVFFFDLNPKPIKTVKKAGQVTIGNSHSPQPSLLKPRDPQKSQNTTF